MADVSFQRKDYSDALEAWQLVDDVVAGEKAVKEGGTTYLPKPNPHDDSKENKDRYKNYIARAVFYNATGRTLQGLVGAVFRKTPELQVVGSLDYVDDDIDGAGVSIFQQSQSALRAVLKQGRLGLLVDYPAISAPASRADMASGMIRSTVTMYSASQIINWRTEQVGAQHKLTLVVLAEQHETVSEDGFGLDTEPQMRVLRFAGEVDANGAEGPKRYSVEIWRKVGDEQKWTRVEAYTPLRASGGQWEEIPFTFVGANNNDASIDPSPLYDMAVINIAHYRNSADYEDSVFFCGQVQPWITGLDEQWRDWLTEQGIYVGSRSPLLLPENSAYGMEQAGENSMVKGAMDQKEDQMVALGARLVQPGTAVKTATEAQADNESEHSVLSLAASNVSEAYTKVLVWMAEFMGGEGGEQVYQLNQDFAEHRLDPQMLTALIQAWQSGKLPESDLWAQLRKFGVVDPEKTDEELREELENQNPGLSLDDGDESGTG